MESLRLLVCCYCGRTVLHVRISRKILSGFCTYYTVYCGIYYYYIILRT